MPRREDHDRIAWVNGRGEADLAVSRTGTLVYTPAISGDRMLVWLDRRGQELPVAAPSRLYADVQMSPDGTRCVGHPRR